MAFSPDGRRIASGSKRSVGCDNTVRVWDTQTGECLEVIHGNGDVTAITAGPLVFPVRAVVRDQETLIESAADGRPLAWFPEPLDPIVTNPSGHLWAANKGNHLYLLALEGGAAESKNDER